VGATRLFAGLCSGVVALTWLGCGSAGAIVQALDPNTAGLVREAHGLAEHIHDHHFFDGEPSTLEDHCEAHDRYDELEAKFDDAVLRGDILAAALIGDALGDLGDEIGGDEYLANKYYGGYVWCFCAIVDHIIGHHTSYAVVQYGLTNSQPGVEDFTGNGKSGVFGGALGFTIPATQDGSYGYGQLGIYAPRGQTDLFSAASGYSSRTNWLMTADGGLAKRIDSTPIYVRASFGLAWGQVEVNSPVGSDRKLSWGPTVDAGLTWELDRSWSLDFDLRYVDLRTVDVNPAPGVKFPFNDKISWAMFGLRYRLGTTH
jgi:opacity protein-like surface antigen